MFGFGLVPICSGLGPTVLYTEEYFSKAVEKISLMLSLIPNVLSDVACNVLFSYIPVMLGGTVLMVSIKVYSCCSMIVGNFVDVYPLGIIAVLMNRFIYRYAFGMLIPPFPFYPFPLRYSLSLPIPRLPDPFPSFPQPLTLRNRLKGPIEYSVALNSRLERISYYLHISFQAAFLENRAQQAKLAKL